MLASNKTFKHIKNILRILFISEHDSYVLISIFGLDNCLFVCENKTKVQIHHDIVNKDIFNPNYHTESNKSLTKIARRYFFLSRLAIYNNNLLNK